MQSHSPCLNRGSGPPCTRVSSASPSAVPTGATNAAKAGPGCPPVNPREMVYTVPIAGGTQQETGAPLTSSPSCTRSSDLYLPTPATCQAMCCTYCGQTLPPLASSLSEELGRGKFYFLRADHESGPC